MLSLTLTAGEGDVVEGAAVHGESGDEGAQQLEGAGGIVEGIVPAVVGVIMNQGGHSRGDAQGFAHG